MFALESAMDELAYALDLDPLALRLRNEPSTEPASGLPFGGRHLVECLTTGADKFGWAVARPDTRACGGAAVGCSAPAWRRRCTPSTSPAPRRPPGPSRTARSRVSVAAVDLGTGARTVLWQAAADVLGVPPYRVSIHIGRSSYGQAPLAGGSSGTASWGGAVRKACTELCRRLAEHGGAVPADGIEVTADTAEDQLAAGPGPALVRRALLRGPGRRRHRPGAGGPAARGLRARPAAQRPHGTLPAARRHGDGRVDGPARADGGRPAAGLFVNHDLAGYHIATNADIRGLEAHSLERADDDVTLAGGKGIGEVGIVGAAAAVANAVYHATGVRVRDLPITLDRVRAR